MKNAMRAAPDHHLPTSTTSTKTILLQVVAEQSHQPRQPPNLPKQVSFMAHYDEGQTSESDGQAESADVPVIDMHVDVGGPNDWKKYSSYSLEVDPKQDDRATEIVLFSLARPHMRSFHCAWWCFFMGFFVWFSIAPLLSEIRTDLDITTAEVWTSSIAAVGTTIFTRFILGPLCDKYGARILFSAVLCATAIPTACTGLIQTAGGLTVLRSFIGIVGGTFVMNQYWLSMTFAKECVGTANALGAGWGNLGGGVTQLVVGSMLFPLFKWIYSGDSEKSWRTVCVVPALMAFCSGAVCYFAADDSPKGQYWERKRSGQRPEVSATDSFLLASNNWNTWILFFQYACCFGVEITMNNAVALYFKDEFGQSTESAAAIASTFGWMNLFARGCGGIASDYANERWGGMGGRIMIQTYFLAFEGVMVMIFATCESLSTSIVAMLVFSLFVQAAEGSSFGIVPYIDGRCTGSISGIVGAGGNVGAVGFSLGFRQMSYRHGFFIMGFSILCSAFLSAFIKIEGHSTLLSDDGNANADDGGYGRKHKRVAHFLHLNHPLRKEATAAETSTTDN